MTARVVAGMTTSLDGFVSDRDGRVGRLFTDLADMPETDSGREQIAQTGAVVMGRRTFAMGDPDSYVGTYEYQVPIFVLTHEPPRKPPKQDEHLTFTFVTDGVESAVKQARAAAGDNTVQCLGVSVVRQLLLAGLVDELTVDVMPVLLGSGKRLFDDPELAGIALEKIGVQETGSRTELRFAVKR